MFPGYNIDSAEETMLGGNQFRSDSNRLMWKAEKNIKKENGIENINKHQKEHSLAIPDVELNPMEIRTFILRLSQI